MSAEIEVVKERFFKILLSRLDEFEQDLLSDFDVDDYYSPNDFVFCLTPDEYRLLRSFKNEKVKKTNKC